MFNCCHQLWAIYMKKSTTLQDRKTKKDLLFLICCWKVFGKVVTNGKEDFGKVITNGKDDFEKVVTKGTLIRYINNITLNTSIEMIFKRIKQQNQELLPTQLA